MQFVVFTVFSPVFLTILSVTASPALASQEHSGKLLNASPHQDKVIRQSWDRAIGAKDPRRVWPNAVMVYTISPKMRDPQVDVIKSAMNIITKKTCVTFKERTDETDYVDIKAGDACLSRIGRIGGYQHLLLQSPGCGDHVGNVLHELLHALGLLHEQSRPDRDRYIEIVKQNMQDDAEHSFEQYNWDIVQNLTVPYDLNSVMHYNVYVFSKNGLPTMIAKRKGTSIPYRVKDMSAGDTKFVNLMYKCK